MNGKGFYLFVALLLLAMFAITAFFFRGSGGSFVGVASSRPYKLNADRAGVIIRIGVNEGQQVSEGDFLAEIVSNELDIEIDKLSNQVETLISEQVEKATLAKSEIQYIQAEAGINTEEVNTELLESEAEAELNQRLARKFSLSSDTVVDIDPVKVKINSLQQQKAQYERAMRIKATDILAESKVEQRVLTNQITLLSKELELLKKERQKLKKFSASPGVVETVFVREGEQVDAFTPVLSINPIHPTTVTGYLTARKTKLPVGSTVSLKSMEQSNNTATGRVIGYGSVVELPEILQKSTAVKAFGVEMFIQIDSVNNFSSGERIMIR